MPYPPQDGSALKDTYHNLNDNQPDDNPLQPRSVAVVLVIPQHVEHFSQHLRARRATVRSLTNPPITCRLPAMLLARMYTTHPRSDPSTWGMPSAHGKWWPGPTMPRVPRTSKTPMIAHRRMSQMTIHSRYEACEVSCTSLTSSSISCSTCRHTPLVRGDSPIPPHGTLTTQSHTLPARCHT